MVDAKVKIIKREGKPDALCIGIQAYRLFIRQVTNTEGERLYSITLNKTVKVAKDEAKFDYKKLQTGFLRNTDLDLLISKLIEMSE